MITLVLVLRHSNENRSILLRAARGRFSVLAGRVAVSLVDCTATVNSRLQAGSRLGQSYEMGGFSLDHPRGARIAKLARTRASGEEQVGCSKVCLPRGAS